MNQDPAIKICPYLRCPQDKAVRLHDPTQAHRCHATVDSFSPSAVQQSSCCFNSAIFSRCPYYVAASGGTPQPVGVTIRPQRRGNLFAQMGRFFSLGKKKKRRVYYT